MTKNYEVQVVESLAVAMLEDMERRNLIRLKPSESADRFLELVRKFRAIGDAPSLEEITAEVEIVRQKRYEGKNED